MCVCTRARETYRVIQLYLLNITRYFRYTRAAISVSIFCHTISRTCNHLVCMKLRGIDRGRYRTNVHAYNEHAVEGTCRKGRYGGSRAANLSTDVSDVRPTRAYSLLIDSSPRNQAMLRHCSMFATIYLWRCPNDEMLIPIVIFLC